MQQTSERASRGPAAAFSALVGVAVASVVGAMGLGAASLAQAAEREPRATPGAGSWQSSPYRNFSPTPAILPGRVLYFDEADGLPLTAALSSELRRLNLELFEKQGWRSPFSEGDPLRIYVARKEAEGMRRMAARSIENGRLRAPAIQLDGTGLSDRRIVREVARLYASAVLAAYDVPDASFFTAAAADYLANLAETEEEREAARVAAAAPELDLDRAPVAVGRAFVEEFARAAGGPAGLRLAWERAREAGEQILPAVARAAAETSGERAEAIALRFAARLYARLEAEPGPSRIGLEDLQTGAFDTAVAGPLVLRHRTFLPGDVSAALRVAWPADSGLAAVVVRYRDAQLPPDVVFLTPGETATVALSGVARVEWVVEGGTARVPSSPAFFERIPEFPFTGMSASAEAAVDGPRLTWTTASHERLAGWAVFREQLLPDGRVARTGPQIVPASNRGDESLRYAYLDSTAVPGAWYRYTLWAVTEDGLLARAFSATLKAAE